MRRLMKKVAINGLKHWKVSISIQMSWVDSLSRIYVWLKVHISGIGHVIQMQDNLH